MKFSTRSDWHHQPNKLTTLLENRRMEGVVIYDLTASNPTTCGISYPEKDLLSALSNPQSLKYQPDPRGLLSAREAVSLYYADKNISTDPSNIFLTASTSEAYSFALKLLCNSGDNVLVPKPSYPLFDYLARLNDIELHNYHLRYYNEWQIDIDSIKNGITKNTKAIVVINPNNPTGMFLKQNDYCDIVAIAKENNLALIVDEVFIDYAFKHNETRIISTAGESDVLTFTLNGISKTAGLPQMKLGWIIVSGSQSSASDAKERLEIICDTFLSVNTPVQVALSHLLDAGEIVRRKIREQVKDNYAYLCKTLTTSSICSPLSCEGGWYGIIRVPRTKTDEEWALELLEKRDVYVFPGYFFDFDKDGYLVISLLPTTNIFQVGIREMLQFIV